MSPAAKSIAIFGAMMVLAGISLLISPQLVLWLELPLEDGFWIRFVGILILCLGYYYLQAARKEMRDFFRWTIYGRAAVFLFVLVAIAKDPSLKGLLVIGFCDLAGSLWTGTCLFRTKYRSK